MQFLCFTSFENSFKSNYGSRLLNMQNLATLYIHKEYPTDFENIFDRFDSEATVIG